MFRETLLNNPQSGRNTPNEGFFDSKHFTEIDYNQRRVQRLTDASGRQKKLSAQRQLDLERERQLKEARLDENKEDGPRGPCELCIKASTRASQINDSDVFKALRRPLAPRCTCMDPKDGGLPILPVEYPVDIDEWAYKPFSTIVSGGAIGYRDHFPLLMQKCTEAEEKDNMQVKTETRRHSVVTTNYLTGRIKLESTGGKDVHMSVFPVLHVIVSSDEESSSNDEDEDKPQDLPSCLETKDDTPTPRRRTSLVPTPGQQRRRLSISPKGLPGYGPMAGPGKPRVVRRRSIDHGSLALSFARALEAASDAMAPISEESQERRAVSPGVEFDVKHAEETMIHMEHNLQTLEKFLQGGSSTSSASDMSSGDDSQ